MYMPRFWFLIIATLILVFCAFALGVSAVPGDPPPFGDWVINENIEYDGKTGYVEGNITIMPQNTLTITDAVLTVNHSIRVEDQGNIIIRNSTIQFNCSMSYPNAFDVEIGGNCEIVDGDDNIETPSDASHITSVNDIPYNFTVNQDTSFTLSNSVISKCGRPFDDPDLKEGLVVKSKNAMITGSIIRDGYFGLFLDGAEGATVDNVTITDCYNGLMMQATSTCKISSSQMINNTQYGAEIWYWQGALTMNSVHMEGNGQANLRMFSVSGFAIEIIKCSFGPGGSVGMNLEDVADTFFLRNQVTGCDEGIRVLDGDVNIVNLTVTDCNSGVDVTGLARISFVDLNLVNTTIDVEDTTDTNITSVSQCMWNNSIASLTCDVVARAGSTFTIESSRLDFEKSDDVPNGLWSLPGGNLQVYNSTVDSPVTHSLICHLADGSQVEFFQSTFSHLGASTSNVQRMGMYLAGTGQIKEVMLTDSFVGLVFGKAQINVINLTIQDCLTGMIADGAYGRGGLTIYGLEVRDCDVSVRAINDGALFVEDGRFNLGGEGFNITTGTVTLKDSWVSDPTTGRKTASLRQTAILNLINSGSSKVFDIGPSDNLVNIIWYLNLTLKYLSDDSNLSKALITVEESTGVISDLDVQAGVDGKIQEMELREKMYTPDVITTTPHTITVTKGDLEDSFHITLDRSTDHEFFMDNYPPGLLIQSPANGSLHNIATITFEGEAWDACVTATDGLASLMYRVNDGPWSPVDLPLLTEWTFEAVLDDGFHVVEIQVIDLIGNMNSTIVSVEVDSEPPSLTIISPEEGIYINETEVMVDGKTDPNVTVTVNDVIVEVDTMGLFNRTLTLDEGLNVIVVVATNVQGITVTKTRNVTVDTEEPEVILDQEDFLTNQLTFEISGSKEPNATIYVDGYLTEFFGSVRFNTVVDIPEEGLNAVDIWSEDMAGNNWSTTVIVVRDTTPPDLTVGQLPEYTNQATVTVQGSTDDPDATVTVNGEVVTPTGLTFAHIVTLNEGPNTITVEAEDDLGNAAEPIIQMVTLSTTPPSLVILTPEKIETEEDEHDLEGETDPGLPVSVHVILGGYSKMYNLVAGDDGSFFLSVALPQIGNHSVTITVTNEAGNRATEEVFFVRNRQDVIKPDPPDDPPWLEENWAYVILAAAILASIGIWMMTLSAGKRRREQIRMEREAQASKGAEEAEEEGDWDEETEDMEAPEDEVGKSEDVVEDGEGPAGEPAEGGEWEETPEDDDAGAEDEEDRP